MAHRHRSYTSITGKGSFSMAVLP